MEEPEEQPGTATKEEGVAPRPQDTTGGQDAFAPKSNQTVETNNEELVPASESSSGEVKDVTPATEAPTAHEPQEKKETTSNTRSASAPEGLETTSASKQSLESPKQQRATDKVRTIPRPPPPASKAPRSPIERSVSVKEKPTTHFTPPRSQSKEEGSEPSESGKEPVRRKSAKDLISMYNQQIISTSSSTGNIKGHERSTSNPGSPARSKIFKRVKSPESEEKSQV